MKIPPHEKVIIENYLYRKVLRENLEGMMDSPFTNASEAVRIAAVANIRLRQKLDDSKLWTVWRQEKMSSVLAWRPLLNCSDFCVAACIGAYVVAGGPALELYKMVGMRKG